MELLIPLVAFALVALYVWRAPERRRFNPVADADRESTRWAQEVEAQR